MRSWCTGYFGLLAAGVLLVLPQTGSAQRLYSQSRDEAAQEAKKRAEAITSGEVFNTQVRNLGRLAKQDFATYLRVARTRMRAEVNDFQMWSGVKEGVRRRLKDTLHGPPVAYDPVKLAMAKLAAETRIAAAKTALEGLKKQIEALKDSQLNRAAAEFEDLDRLEKLIKQLEGLAKLPPSENPEMSLSALTELAEVGGRFETLYKQYQSTLGEIEKSTEKVLELRVPLAQLALESAQADLDHLNTVSAVLLRRTTEEIEVARLERDFHGLYGFVLDELKYYGLSEESGIEELFTQLLSDPHAASLTQAVDETSTQIDLDDTLRFTRDSKPRYSFVQVDQETLEVTAVSGKTLTVKRGARGTIPTKHAKAAGIRRLLSREERRDRLDSNLRALYFATAIVAHGGLPARLSELRLAHEEHLYSIRRSALEARSYETTVRTGVQRLALYHQGGLRAEKVAQLLHHLATIAIPPAIITK